MSLSAGPSPPRGLSLSALGYCPQSPDEAEGRVAGGESPAQRLSA